MCPPCAAQPPRQSTSPASSAAGSPGGRPPVGRRPPTGELRVVQWNINGLCSKAAELGALCQREDAAIVLLQETKLSAEATISLPGYSVVRRDRTARGGGLATFVRLDTPYVRVDNVPSDDGTTTEALSIKVHRGSQQPLHVSPFPRFPVLEQLCQLGEDRLLLGDLNAHSATWHSPIDDARVGLVENTHTIVYGLWVIWAVYGY